MSLNVFAKPEEELKLTMRHWLLLSCAFSCVLICIRGIVTSTPTYLFLVWNLFLGFVPYAISEWLSRNLPVLENKWKRTAVLSVWLVFIPNSFYIITDLFHLDRFDSAPKWFDLLLLFSFGWNGLLLGILSLKRIELIMQVIRGRRHSLFFVFAVMWLNAFGIYIGRYLRYNSWDILLQPFSLFGEILHLLFHPFRNSMQWSMISTWALFMTLFYFTIKKLAEHFTSSGNPIKHK